MAQVFAEIGGKQYQFPDQASADGAKQEFEQGVLSRYPPNVRMLAQGLASYKLQVPAGFALARPNSPWNLAAQAAMELDPDFSATEYPKRQAVLKDFTSGTTAKNLTSLNTVVRHLQKMKESADALNNFSGIGTLFNAPWNAIENATGDPRVGNYNKARQAVATELTRAFRGTGGAEQDIQAWLKQFSENSSPAQFSAGIKTATDLMAGRIAALRDQYKNGMGANKDFQFLSPNARTVLSSIGIDPNDVDPAYTGGFGSASPGGSQAPTGPQVGQPTGIPQVGQTFNGGRITKVTKVE